jgi:uncharacterized protein
LRLVWSPNVTPIRFALLGLLLPVCLLAAFPTPQGAVTDEAGVLDAKARAELGALLRDVEQQTSAEIAVVTVPSLDGMTVEEYANRLFKAWGIGKKGRDNGVLVLVAPTEHKMRIEVGYGLEAVLPDGLAGQIVRTECLPRFKEGDYARGLHDGVARVAAIVRANHTLTADERSAIDESDQPPGLPMFVFFALFIAPGFFGVGLGWRIKTVAPLLFGLIFGGVAMLMALIPFFHAWPILQVPLAIVMMRWGYKKGASPGWITPFRPAPADGGPLRGWVAGGYASSSGGSSSASSGASSGSDSSGGSSSGGFGGGSSGGGGASGSW